MQSAVDISNRCVRLLSTIDLDEVLASVAEIIGEVCSPQAVAILMWDTDLETFGDRFFFGPRKKELVKLAEAFADEEQSEPERKIFEVDATELGVTLHKDLDSVHCYRVVYDGSLCACILIAGADDEVEADEIVEDLEHYPFGTALYHGWEFKELERENTRLRSQYEEMEEKTSMLEEQTMKLIRDMTSRDTLRTRQVDRERLVYWISNTVRSSVHIQEVLETTVEKIGTTIGVSRCLLLRAVDSADRLVVFEWCKQNTEPVKNLFYSDEGFEFTQSALSTPSPHDLVDTDLDRHHKYSKSFLQKLGIRSGLIVPLVLRDNVLGVLFLQDCLQPRDWSIDDVSMIGSLADNLSVAIENAELHQERERQAVTDGLTGVANRRSFNESLTREFERARRYGETLSLVLIDLDFLKKINDTYGHQVGDEAIKMIGKMLRQSSRSIDSAARYGGEEFCLLLPNTEIDMAEQLADRLRRLINEEDIEGPGRISASLGVASYPMHADNEEALFQRADEALYAAKQAGRNQVKIATAAPEGFDMKTNGRAKEPAATTEPNGDNPQNPTKESTMLDIK
jgi:diguanylate cyclase (GGDEF)-like protein